MIAVKDGDSLKQLSKLGTACDCHKSLQELLPVVKMATALTADQLSRQLKDLKLELKESHHARELASAEKVCKEFFGLHLPVESEVDIQS